MFNNISKNKLKIIVLFKYIFQLILAPLIMGIVFIFIALIIAFFISGFLDGLKIIFINKYPIFRGIELPGWSLLILFMYFINLLNILSIIPFIKLLLDCISKKDEETKEIEFANVMPPYELQCIRQSKRFMCDTFSRKNNVEVFIYDEHKTKYRLFWNEKYGDVKKEEEMSKAKRLKISYFKHSKIIFRCDVLEYDNG